MVGYESTLKEGKYIYEGIMSYDDMYKLMRIAEDNHLTAISPNEYISFLINEYYSRNYEKP